MEHRNRVGRTPCETTSCASRMGGKNRNRKEEETWIRRRSIISWFDSWDCRFRGDSNACHNIIYQSERLDDATPRSTSSTLIIYDHDTFVHTFSFMSNILHLYQFYIRSIRHIHTRSLIYRRSVSHSLFVQKSRKSYTHIVHSGTKVIHYVPSAIFTAAYDDSGVSQDEISPCLRPPCPFIQVFFLQLFLVSIFGDGVFF
jgi:hypothetical protein